MEHASAQYFPPPPRYFGKKIFFFSLPPRSFYSSPEAATQIFSSFFQPIFLPSQVGPFFSVLRGLFFFPVSIKELSRKSHFFFFFFAPHFGALLFRFLPLSNIPALPL